MRQQGEPGLTILDTLLTSRWPQPKATLCQLPPPSKVPSALLANYYIQALPLLLCLGLLILDTASHKQPSACPLIRTNLYHHYHTIAQRYTLTQEQPLALSPCTLSILLLLYFDCVLSHLSFVKGNKLNLHPSCPTGPFCCKYVV